MKHFTTKKIALVAIFSALYYILSFIPGIKAIGATNVTINIEAFIASIFGFILGPYLGALTAFMGAFLSWMLPPGAPSLTSLIFLPSPVINAFIVGLIYTKKWKMAFVTLLAVISIFWFLPAAQPWNEYSYVGFWVMWDKILALSFIIPSIFLMNKIAKSSIKIPENNEKTTTVKKDFSMILTVFAAFLILINAWMIFLEGNVIKFRFSIFDTILELKFGSKDVILQTSSYGYIWLLLGISILICAVMLHFKPNKHFFWNSLIFTFSCISAVIGGGFYIGLFLGVLGAIFGSLKRKISMPKITSSYGFNETLLYFVLAFIGNESDNALGSVLYATPFVYEGIFGITSLDFLRMSFIIAPFFYFGIRFFQAIITTVIATPLLRNLKAAGFDLFEGKSKISK
jgi:hypothetical protein